VGGGAASRWLVETIKNQKDRVNLQQLTLTQYVQTFHDTWLDTQWQ
jgi:hypothetical protein